MQTLVAVLGPLCLLLSACSSSPSTNDQGVADLSVAGDLSICNSDLGADPSACGHPCDVGNSLGVGKYCKTSNDCANNGSAVICSSILNSAGDPMNTFFCTLPMTCDNTTDCGSAATCQTVPGKGSGCTPNRCVAGLDR